MAMVNAADGTISAQYEYSPFGETLSATGSEAAANPFRFSTKHVDSESGFLYYGHRYFNPSTGRWLSREPLQERHGPSTYSFAANDGVNNLDILGLLDATVHSINYNQHGTVDRNRDTYPYVKVEEAGEKTAVPLNATAAKPAASVTLKLDYGFNASISAWTMLSADGGINSLQVSTQLDGSVNVCCPCPFKKARAKWKVGASSLGNSGTVVNAHAGFNNNKQAITASNRPADSQIGTSDKDLDTLSYCTTFAFVIGQGWFDTSKTGLTRSLVFVQARFECILD
jgi:RHS repeat-associated protein